MLSLDREDKKIALSLRRATKDPWQSLESKYGVNEIVEGEVTKLAPFGAFVRLTDGIEGTGPRLRSGRRGARFDARGRLRQVPNPEH